MSCRRGSTGVSFRPSFRCRWGVFRACNDPHHTYCPNCQVDVGRLGRYQDRNYNANINTYPPSIFIKAHIWAQSSMLRGISPTGTWELQEKVSAASIFIILQPDMLGLLEDSVASENHQRGVRLAVSERSVFFLPTSVVSNPNLYPVVQCFSIGDGQSTLAHMLWKFLQADALVNCILAKVSHCHLAISRRRWRLTKRWQAHFGWRMLSMSEM